MATTPHLGLTLVEQAQAQKEVTVNMALMRIDALLNTGALDKDLSTPPGSPSEGDVYIVASGATGDWLGKGGCIAYFEQIWRFIAPREGCRLRVADEKQDYVFDGVNWTPTDVLAIQVQVGSAYMLAATDIGRIVECDHTSALTVTLPNSLPQGFCCRVMQKGTGMVSFSVAAGATLQQRQSHGKTAGRYAVCELYVTENASGAGAVYVLSGDTSA